MNKYLAPCIYHIFSFVLFGTSFDIADNFVPCAWIAQFCCL